MISRERREEPDTLLEWKVRIFFVGAAVLLASMLLDLRPLALAAIVILGLGAAIVLVDRIRNRRPMPAWSDDEDPAADDPPRPA